MAKLKRLEKYHKKAIELKYKGLEYADIAEKLKEGFAKSRPKFNEQTIKDWFKESGDLLVPYQTYETEWDAINKELSIAAKKAGILILEKNFRMTCEMLIALLGSETDNVKLGAIKEILDRILGKARLPVDLSGSVSVDTSKYEQRLDAVRKRRELENK